MLIEYMPVRVAECAVVTIDGELRWYREGLPLRPHTGCKGFLLYSAPLSSFTQKANANSISLSSTQKSCLLFES